MLEESDAEAYELLALKEENKRLRKSADALEANNNAVHAENKRLREALHQIYGEACQLLNSEDDVDAWAFVKSARDKALEGA
jgi:FtsZ-binding cell division protein ZapB